MKSTFGEIIMYVMSGIFIIPYFLSGCQDIEFLLAALIAFLSVFIEKKKNWSRQKKIYLGMGLGVMFGIIYGIHVNDFWVMLAITVSAGASLWVLAKLLKIL